MLNRTFLFFFVIVMFFPLLISAQVGGKHTYNFLTLPNSARVAALGGDVVSIKDNDLNFVFHNPALLNSEMHNSMVMNYINYFADINFGYVSYAWNKAKWGNLAAGLHYINYGEFTEADETGTILGSFKAADYSLNLFWSKQLDSMFSVGVNVKPVLSQLERYSSFGIATDLGITYYNPHNQFTTALVLKNIGTQLKPYYQGNFEPLPFEIQLGISKKLAHAPFRFTILAQHLQMLDMTYEDPNNPSQTIDQFTGEVVEQSNLEKYSDMVLRHLVVGLEFLPTKNFHVDFSYNHQRRKEMQVDTRAYMVGFSWGFGFRISKFHISYGRASYHLAGASNHFSIVTHLSEFYQRETPVSQ